MVGGGAGASKEKHNGTKKTAPLARCPPTLLPGTENGTKRNAVPGPGTKEKQPRTVLTAARRRRLAGTHGRCSALLVDVRLLLLLVLCPVRG